jgi:hypothetical protein
MAPTFCCVTIFRDGASLVCAFPDWKIVIFCLSSFSGKQWKMVNGSAFDVFLALSNQDKKSIISLASELSKRGVKPWINKDEIRLGQSFEEVIQQGLQNSKAISG